MAPSLDQDSRINEENKESVEFSATLLWRVVGSTVWGTLQNF
jgi:hypothetical protein